ncbi:kinase-like domain-containing protein [Sporodiniella umbellata]|nr:kinase-like domain-containing protein [Sporodiniella umbellata]
MQAPSAYNKRNHTLPIMDDSYKFISKKGSFKRSFSWLEDENVCRKQSKPNLEVKEQKKNCSLFKPDWKNNPNAWAFLQSQSSKHNSKYLSKKSDRSGRTGYMLGRDPSCDISISEKKISKRHCLIFMETGDNGASKGIRIFLQDISLNGTFVNNELVGTDQRRLLRSGDLIQLKVPGEEDALNSTFRIVFPSYFVANTCQDDYTFREVLGKGNFASVYRARERKTNDLVAIKVIQKARLDNRPKLLKSVTDEISIMMAMEKHPGIVSIDRIYSDQSRFFFVLEYVPDGDLFSFVTQKEKLTENETRFIFWQLFNATKWLHQNKIAHRDLKPENILVASKDLLHVKISDFGLAKIITKDKGLDSQCGTAHYVAPEILTETRSYNMQCDLWSLGVVMYICLCGYPPFNDETDTPMKLQITKGLYGFQSPFWNDISAKAIELIKGLLNINPKQRLTCDEALVIKLAIISNLDFLLLFYLVFC